MHETVDNLKCENESFLQKDHVSQISFFCPDILHPLHSKRIAQSVTITDSHVHLDMRILAENEISQFSAV